MSFRFRKSSSKDRINDTMIIGDFLNGSLTSKALGPAS